VYNKLLKPGQSFRITLYIYSMNRTLIYSCIRLLKNKSYLRDEKLNLNRFTQKVTSYNRVTSEKSKKEKLISIRY
jgi:hypothetical protein